MTKTERTLLMMGCPEVPVQMSIVLYLSNKLTTMGHDVTVAGTDAALKLLRISDPEEHYVKKTMDIDQCIVDIVEKKVDFDSCFAFMHSDAGMTYAATMAAISQAKIYAVVFGKNAEAVAETIEFQAEKIVAKAAHNPIPPEEQDRSGDTMSCVEQMKYKLYLEWISFKEARDFIEKNADEVYYVDPGYKIFKDYYIIGVPPIAMGVKGNELLFTYVKPCHGTFVMAIDSDEEIKRLRDSEQEKVKASLKKTQTKKGTEKAEAAPGSFQDLWKK